MDAKLNPDSKYVKEMEEMFSLRKEAIDLLGLVAAEWESDPMSVQCFDLRIVRRAKEVVDRLKELPDF